MTTYLDAATALPIPSDEQTHAFAEYVTGAHSWYKHLPILPLSPFVFFLDPNAGRSMVHVSDEEVRFVDNTSRGIHYTWQPTEAYRRRFGLWNYHAPYGKRLQYMTGRGVVDTAGAGLQVADANSTCWLEIPASLVQAGTALVSSLMYCAPGGRPEQYQREPRDRVSVFEPFDGLPADGEGHGAAISAIHRLIALREGAEFRSDEAWFNDSKNALYARADAVGNFRGKVRDSKAYKVAEAIWEQSASRKRELAEILRLVAAIDEERASQIESMQAAMRRFVETLHADAPGSA